MDWVDAIDGVVEAGADWILDLGPGDLLTRMTTPALRGQGVGIIAASSRGGHRNLLTPGAAPEVQPAWSAFAPKPVTLPDGRVVVETSFTKMTGRSPILLAGMTPTTVDAKIVAAAANAGHWAELAGGGQVTEDIFTDRVAELSTLLEPGRAIQFNSLFLDPYLWKLQLGGRRIVQRARAAGAAIDGVVVTAGIPELDEAVALIEEPLRGRNQLRLVQAGYRRADPRSDPHRQRGSVLPGQRPYRGWPRRRAPLVGRPRRPAADHLRRGSARAPTW